MSPEFIPFIFEKILELGTNDVWAQNILMKKGKTEINQIDFKAFTTGKSKTENHKEILFYCRVK